MKGSNLALEQDNDIFSEFFSPLAEEIFFRYFSTNYTPVLARHAGSDGSMSASGSAGPGFDPRRGSKFSFENFQPRG